MKFKKVQKILVLIFSVLFQIIFSSYLYPQISQKYLYFDGIKDYADCGFNEIYRPSAHLTLSVWIKPDSLNDWHSIIWCGSYYENHYALKITPDNKIRALVWINGPHVIFSESTIELNKGYYVSMTYDTSKPENNFELYINGNLEGQQNLKGDIGRDTNPFIIGVYPGWYNQYFKGIISDIQIWNRALSQNEIQQKINQTLDPKNEQGLVAYWPVNEGQGNILHDLSGNGNDGIINWAEWNPSNKIQAVISSPEIWLDSNYDGFADQKVSAANSIGNISSYTWTVGNDTVATGVNPVINLPTGTQYLGLTVENDSGGVSKDSVMISVYASKVNTNGPIYSAVSQLNSNTFFVSSGDDKVYQFDSSGAVYWTYLTGGDIQSTVTVSDSNNIFVTSSDTRLYSFNNLGTPNWDKAMGGIIVSSPTIDKDKYILVGLTTGRLFALSYNGDIKWNFQTDDAIVASPVVGENGNIYFGSKDKNLYAVSTNGNLLWKYTTMDSIVSSPALCADHSIIIGSKDGYLYKFNENGGLDWKFNTAGAIYSAPIIGENGQIFIGSCSGYFYSISNSGELIWKYYTNSSIKSTASISDDGSTIYVGNDNGYLLALTINGNLKWYFKSNGAISAPTLITNKNLLIAGCKDGSLYIMKENSNQIGKKMSGIKLEWPTYLGNNQRTGDQKTLVTDVKKNGGIIDNYSLMQNFPNPFNPVTTISFNLPQESIVKISITNILGQIVKEFNIGRKGIGNYQINWNASSASSGIYFYSMDAVPTNGTKEFRSVKKMILLK